MKITSPARTSIIPRDVPLQHGHTLILDTLGTNKQRGPAQRANVFSTQKNLPIIGRAQGGDEGSLVIEEQPIDWTYRPADLQGVHGAFAVFVTGDSMLPKYKNQDLAYIHPTLRVRRGRYVLVETSEHSGLIKQFERWDGDTLIVRQFNPNKELSFTKEEVRRVMLVIGSLDA